jgi:glutamyl-tRNA synthetase
VQERMQLLGEAPGLLAFLFTDDDAIVVEPEAMPKDGAAEVLDASIAALGHVIAWDHDHIESALRTALIDGLGLKPRVAFGPLRSAISGRRISPPLFESMELLGKESSLFRLAKLRDRL